MDITSFVQGLSDGRLFQEIQNSSPSSRIILSFRDNEVVFIGAEECPFTQALLIEAVHSLREEEIGLCLSKAEVVCRFLNGKLAPLYYAGY
jgi:hypothetical protein